MCLLFTAVVAVFVFSLFCRTGILGHRSFVVQQICAPTAGMLCAEEEVVTARSQHVTGCRGCVGSALFVWGVVETSLTGCSVFYY